MTAPIRTGLFEYRTSTPRYPSIAECSWSTSKPGPCQQRDCPMHLEHTETATRTVGIGIVSHAKLVKNKRKAFGSHTVTCAMDVATAGPSTLETIGALMGMSAQSVQEIEDEALRKIRTCMPEASKMLKEML